jgi:hypothetical protein
LHDDETKEVWEVKPISYMNKNSDRNKQMTEQLKGYLKNENKRGYILGNDKFMFMDYTVNTYGATPGEVYYTFYRDQDSRSQSTEPSTVASFTPAVEPQNINAGAISVNPDYQREATEPWLGGVSSRYDSQFTWADVVDVVVSIGQSLLYVGAIASYTAFMFYMVSSLVPGT